MKEHGRQLRTCLKCGRVAFGVSRQYAVGQARRFTRFIRSVYGQQVADQYGIKDPSNYTQDWRKEYGRCGCGNSWENFRDAKEDDCPDGCTLSPIIVLGKR